MASIRDNVFELISEKEEIERRIKLFWQVLTSNNIGLSEPLVDDEGFPRSDIDVYQVRKARHQIKCLENDHKVIFKKIEEGLIKIHNKGLGAELDPDGMHEPAPISSFIAFTKIVSVEVGSPADVDGLKVGDKICKFGSVVSTNFRTLTDIAGVVQHSINKPIQVYVRRKSAELNLSLTPRQWSGRGILGCNIVPLDEPER